MSRQSPSTSGESERRTSHGQKRTFSKLVEDKLAESKHTLDVLYPKKMKLASRIVELQNQIKKLEKQQDVVDKNINKAHEECGNLRFLQSNIVANIICSICSQFYSEPCVTSCGHVFCRYCISKWHSKSTHNNLTKCPLCRSIMVSIKTCEVSKNIANTVRDMSKKFMSKEEMKSSNMFDTPVVQATNRMGFYDFPANNSNDHHTYEEDVEVISDDDNDDDEFDDDSDTPTTSRNTLSQVVPNNEYNCCGVRRSLFN